MTDKTRSMLVLALCELLAMSLWFSASAVVPALKLQYDIGGVQAAALSSSVALGFVAGTLFSAIFGLADRLNSKMFFAGSALGGAAANAAGTLLDPTTAMFVIVRFLVGATMAGVYPVGIRMVATWAAADLGLLVGVLVAASTIGGASAFLLAAFGDLDWRAVMHGGSALAALAAILILLFRPGPRMRQVSVFRARYVLDAWRERPLLLANLGYYGHMWEIYAMWTWLAAWLQASLQTTPLGSDAPFWAKLGAFATIGVGAIGCLAGGALADRFGRTGLTIGAMLISGGCAAIAGFLFGGPPWLLAVFCIVWGIAIVADSAQFSASVVELSDPERVGTMVTVQTCAGFLLTMVSIHLIPLIDSAVGLRWAFLFLCMGPFLGAWAMFALRRDPASTRLANGRR